MPAKRTKPDNETAAAPAKRVRATRSSTARQPKSDSTQDSTESSKAIPPPARKKSRVSPKAASKSQLEPSSSIRSTGKVGTKRKEVPAESIDNDATDKGPNFWLMKAEPESRLEKGIDVKFSIDDLAGREEPEAWDGVRNPTAQKNMREMRKGELAFLYHSNCKVPGIAGVMQIVQEQSTDESAFDAGHPYYDPKSNPENPRWIVVHVSFVKKFERLVPLKELQQYAKPGGELEGLQTLRMSRLSVSRVSPVEWKFILGLAGVEQEELDDIVGSRD